MYYFRMRVQVGLSGLNGKREFRQPLKTGDKRDTKTVAELELIKTMCT